jgi:aspartate/methionine/tyrosine aminotransferase
MDSGMFLPMQMAAIEALNNQDSWYDTVNSVYLRRRKIVEQIMDLLKCSYNKSQVGLFVWGKIPENIPDCESYIEEILMKSLVFITPGFIFGKQGERYIRISLCATEEKLNEAKNRIISLSLNN